MLRGKTIYCIVTGAHRTTTVAVFLNMLKEAHARDIILMPTAAAEPLLDAQTIPDDVIIRRTSNGNMQIPEEDIVVVAPCTFNTFSKIATGIADNYPMSIVHAAIGKKKPVIIAPSMGEQYWLHPVTASHRQTITSFGAEIIWPEYVYEDCELAKITMAPWAKIFDSICHRYKTLRYLNRRDGDDDECRALIAKAYPLFNQCGSFLQQNDYTNATAGCLAMRTEDSKIIITRTGAYLGNLGREDLTVILGHEDRVVRWNGASEPSSEAPLILDIFDMFPQVNVVIHGHCRDITYSPLMTPYLSDEYLSYGKWDEAHKIYDMLKLRYFAIMKLHGEIVLGENFDVAIALYYKKYLETRY